MIKCETFYSSFHNFIHDDMYIYIYVQYVCITRTQYIYKYVPLNLNFVREEKLLYSYIHYNGVILSHLSACRYISTFIYAVYVYT